MGPPSTAPVSSLAPQRAWRDAIVSCEVFEFIDLTLYLMHAPLQDFHGGFGSNAYVAFIEIYAARCFPETSRIVNRLPVFTELSPSAFKFIMQLRCLHCIPLRVLGSDVGSRRGRRCWPFFVNSTHDGNQAKVVEFFEVIVGPNHCVLAICSRVRPIGRTQRYGYRKEHQTDRGTQVASHVRHRYFFEEPGGNFLNIFSTPLSRFFMFLSELLESVSLDVPRHRSFFVLASNRSTINVPTL